MVNKDIKNVIEFKKYGKFSNVIKKMVDDDYIPYTTKFYESLSTKNLEIKYIDDFWKSIEFIKSSSRIIIATRIEIVNQEHLYDLESKQCSCLTSNKICNINKGDKYSSHAVSLFKNRKNGKIYMFDPNGNFNKDKDKWLYKSKDGNFLLDSENFSKNYNIDLPEYEGIQKYCKSLKVNREFIDNCGYCMFYNFIGIEKVRDIFLSKNGTKKDITEVIKSLSDCKNKKNLFSTFPLDKNLGEKSLELIKKIF